MILTNIIKHVLLQPIFSKKIKYSSIIHIYLEQIWIVLSDL